MSVLNQEFLDKDEKEAMEYFAKNGYYVFPVDDQEKIKGLRQRVFDLAVEAAELKDAPDIEDFFNNTEKYITVEVLNKVKLKIMQSLNADPQSRPLIYNLAKRQLWWIVGSELAMQRTLNLSIQLPNDDSSLLPVHSDVWMGNSPYEVVFWIPLVNCFKTKSMYVLPLKQSEAVFNNFEKYSHLSAEKLYESIEKDVVWLDVPFGHGVIFSHSILHGNIVNKEPQTRWTFNVRFKSLLTPYADKGLGESFLPITTRPATKVGYEYIKPRCANV